MNDDTISERIKDRQQLIASTVIHALSILEQKLYAQTGVRKPLQKICLNPAVYDALWVGMSGDLKNLEVKGTIIGIEVARGWDK